MKCTACDFIKKETIEARTLINYEQNLGAQPCPKCKSDTLYVEEKKDLIDEFAELAEMAGADVEVISIETEEGEMLKKSFGGIAAILRFKQN